MEWTHYLVPAAAVIGMVTGLGSLVLGLKNRQYQLKYSPSKLSVIPRLAFSGPMDEYISETYFDERVESALESRKSYISIEVRNLGPNTQRIHDIGFVDHAEDLSACWDFDWIQPSQSFPLSVEPEESVFLYIRYWPRDNGNIFPVAYARTDRSEIFTGTSPIMADFVGSLGRDGGLASS